MMGGDPCCHVCDERVRKTALAAGGPYSAYLMRFMIVCAACGNKRCPKATDHTLECTYSNEPGQTGSVYA